MSYIESMIECQESNLTILRNELSRIEHYPEITGTVITKLVACHRPNCAACAAGHFHGPNAYYQYFENGELKEKYLGKKVRDEYIHKTEANRKYREVEGKIREAEREVRRLRSLIGKGSGA